MRLPTISIASTPLCVPRGALPARQSRCLVVTPVTFPSIADSARLWTSCQNIPRLNPLHPPLVHKRIVSLETPAVHHHNHQRSLAMQRREYHRLGASDGALRATELSLRSPNFTWFVCQRQMEEKGVALKLQLAGGAKDAERLREVDRLALSGERERRIRHGEAMTAYRDENKRVTSRVVRLPHNGGRDNASTRRMLLGYSGGECFELMEQRWRDRALTRSQESLKERELLCLNPINWSGTLK
ncbi:hypothetical protein EYF80_041535 [Liparis tanakae]|uniref:Uncharacterized protein n=1 Tax=Liparis tanakae TaxID=230148 RepID=A0A4Z2G5B1_9TELE|nr:hypothetical protein EYF80_041535 [Liparis tanakae]